MTIQWYNCTKCGALQSEHMLTALRRCNPRCVDEAPEPAAQDTLEQLAETRQRECKTYWIE